MFKTSSTTRRQCEKATRNTADLCLPTDRFFSRWFYRTVERSPIMPGDYYLIPPLERGRRVEQPAYGSDTATETR